MTEPSIDYYRNLILILTVKNIIHFIFDFFSRMKLSMKNQLWKHYPLITVNSYAEIITLWFLFQFFKILLIIFFFNVFFSMITIVISAKIVAFRCNQQRFYPFLSRNQCLPFFQLSNGCTIERNSGTRQPTSWRRKWAISSDRNNKKNNNNQQNRSRPNRKC